MAKDAEIEQVLSLPKEKWQRKKLRLPHSQKREVEKPQKRRSREPTLLKDYRRFCQSESDVYGSETEIRGSECKIHGSETEIRGSECKIHGSECGNRHIRSHDPLFGSEKSPPLKWNFYRLKFRKWEGQLKGDFSRQIPVTPIKSNQQECFLNRRPKGKAKVRDRSS